jgi:hypothetical protein
MTARRLHIATTRATTVLGALFIVWGAGLTLAGEFSASAGLFLGGGVLLVFAGWMGHPDRRRLQNAMHDMAEEFDPLAEPASADQGEALDEAHAPGHQHLRRGR